jgi:hypothetical protein
MDEIRDTLERAVVDALKCSCQKRGVCCPQGIVLRLWAQNIMRVELEQGRLPDPEDIDKLVASMPKLFVSDVEKFYR